MDPDRTDPRGTPWRYPRFTPALSEQAQALAAAVTTPLGLEDRGPWDPEEEYWGEPGDPIEPLLRDVIVGGVRRSWEQERIEPWDGSIEDDGPILAATELHARGKREEARRLLRDLAAEEPRFLDAHAHLGIFALEYSPGLALAHYERGVAVGELSLPEGFDGVLPWGWIDNRPFMRCLHGYGLCLWRLGRSEEAVAVFDAMLWLNPGDNQGMRFLIEEVRAGAQWAPGEEEERSPRNGAREALLEQVAPLLDEPAAPLTPEQARDDFAPLLWLLERGAEDGLPLTETGALGRVIVRETVERFPAWWRAEIHGPPHRESDVWLLEAMHGLARRAGLFRKRHKRLLITKRGRHLAEHPEQLPPALAPFLITGDPFNREVAEIAYALLLLHGEITSEDLKETVYEAVRGRWRTATGDLPAYAVSGTTLGTLDLILCVGAMSGGRSDENCKLAPSGTALLFSALRHQAE